MKRKLTVLDSDFKKATASCITAMAGDKQFRNTKVESLRKTLLAYFRLANSSYLSGLKILEKELEKPIPHKLRASPEAILDALAHGKGLYELLGLTWHDIELLYECASRIAHDNRFEEAREAFFFLCTIAVAVSECWLSLGLVAAKCGHYEEALEACRFAIDVQPENGANYLGYGYVCIQMQDFDAALELCNQGMQFAKQHAKEPWAHRLKETLEEGKRQITSQFQKSQ